MPDAPKAPNLEKLQNVRVALQKFFTGQRSDVTVNVTAGESHYVLSFSPRLHVTPKNHIFGTNTKHSCLTDSMVEEVHHLLNRCGLENERIKKPEIKKRKTKHQARKVGNDKKIDSALRITPTAAATFADTFLKNCRVAARMVLFSKQSGLAA